MGLAPAQYAKATRQKIYSLKNKLKPALRGQGQAQPLQNTSCVTSVMNCELWMNTELLIISHK